MYINMGTPTFLETIEKYAKVLSIYNIRVRTCSYLLLQVYSQ